MSIRNYNEQTTGISTRQPVLPEDLVVVVCPSETLTLLYSSFVSFCCDRLFVSGEGTWNRS